MGTPTIHSRTIFSDLFAGFGLDMDTDPNNITGVAMKALSDQPREPVEYFLQFTQPVRGDRHYPEVLALIEELRGASRTVPLPSQERQPAPDDDYLQALYNKGYESLALTLDGWDGWPWDEIRKLTYAPLVQQLVDLVHLTNGSSNQRAVIELALNIAQRACDSESVALSIAQIGQLTYLVDNAPEAINTLATLSDPDATIKKIEELFSKEADGIGQRLKMHFQAHHVTHLQNPTLARATLIPKVFADTLLLSDGTFNFGLIGAIRHTLLSDKDLSLGFGQELDASLRLLQHSPELRDKLAAVTISSNRGSAAYALACHALGVSTESELTDVDAKRVALAAILSHLRQGSVGSCFATYLGIEVMRARMGHCLDDIAEILRDGHVTTTDQKGLEEQHPILLRLSHDERSESLRLSAKGNIVTSMGTLLPIWKAPGIRSACIAAGIEEDTIEAVCRAALQKCLDQAGGSPSSVRVTHYNFMKFLALTAEELQLGSRGPLYQKMVIGFESQTCHPVLRCWEYSLSSMAEARNDSFLRERQLGALSDTLSRNLNLIFFGHGELKREIRGQILLHFAENSVLLYDPSLNGLDGSLDGNSTSGGFVLYDKMGSEEQSQWVRLDSAQAFRECVGRAVEATKEGVGNSLRHESEKSLMTMILDSLQEFVRSESSTFIHNCLAIYLTGNVNASISSSNPDKLPHTLWIDRIGNMPDQVWDVYFGEKIVDHQKVIPYGADGLLLNIVETCARADEETKRLYRENPLLEIPLGTTAQHAFSLMPGHDSLRPLWENPNFDRDWIRENLEAPGQAVSDMIPSPHATKRICEALECQLIDDDKRSLFQARVETMPANLTYSQLRNKLLFTIQRSSAVRGVHPARLREKVDAILFKHLPYPEKKKLRDAAIHFADTNWNNGEHDIHFAFMFSPFTKRLEVWKVCEDGTGASPISQSSWVTRRWEIPNSLREPLPKDGEEVAFIDWTPFFDPFGVDDPRMVS